MILLLSVTGCKEPILGPELTGSLEGEVRSFDEGEPLAGASITTAPPTEALVAGDDGRFVIDELPEGNYAVTARKSGYGASTVTVLVRPNRITSAVIMLQETDTTETAIPLLDARVLNWKNLPQGDSTFVHVEYRAHNVGTAPIPSYRIYFQIDTDGDTYFAQREGGPLGIGQMDIDAFERLIFDNTATDVVVDTTWVAPLE